MTNYIIEYYNEVKKNRKRNGKWIITVMQFLYDGIKSGMFLYDEKKAEDAVTWIENHCYHTEGVLAPGNLILETWQKAIIASIFGITNEKGNRYFREVLLVIARKNGKSLLAAAIAKYMWQKAGGFGARIYNIAPKLDQADIIYNNVWQMTILDPEYQKLKLELSDRTPQGLKIKDDSELPKHRMSDLYITSTNSTVKKISFDAKKSDGFNPSLCICDEIASWEGDKGLKQYEVMKSGMGARPEGIMLSCTTSGYVNDSIYDELIKRATRFLRGDSEEKKLLPFLYIIDDIEKWNDIDELYKSNPNLGVSITEDYLREEVAIANGSLSKKAEFMCKYANIKQNSSLAWLDARVVDDACGDELSLDDFRNSYCVGGLDLSQTTDLTSACIIIEKDGQLYVFSKFWLPAERIDEATARDGLPYNIYLQRGLIEQSGDNYVDYHDCFNWFRMLVEEYEILPLMVGYDRYSAQYLVQDLQGYGFRTDDVYQGENLWVVLQEMEGLFKDRKVHIGDNDLLKIHLLNSAIKMSVERGRGKLVKLNPNAHIDGVAALADAFTVRQKWYDEIGERLRNEL